MQEGILALPTDNKTIMFTQNKYIVHRIQYQQMYTDDSKNKTDNHNLELSSHVL